MQEGMNLGILEGSCPAVPTGGLEHALCFVATWEVPILVAVLLVAGAAIWWFRRRRRHVARTPLLVFPLDPASGVLPTPRDDPRDNRAGPPAAPAADPAPVEAAPTRTRPTRPPAEVSPDDQTANPGERMVLRVGGAPADPAHAEEASADDAGREDGGGVVRFQAPPDGTLQLLPGRLEVEKGPGEGREIRFVRVPGQPTEITFGRSKGPDFLHVQLDSPTVSRTHARMRFRDGTWFLRNHSKTNPTRVGGRPVGTSEVVLASGDLIEIGAITFRFRQEGGDHRLPFRSSCYTDRGRRPSNQDAVLARTLPDGRELLAVCDGMGAHHAGGIASHRALDSLVKALSEGAALEPAVQRAHQAVRDAAAEEPEREGMGTTLVALLRDGDAYLIANVGDSRAYRIDGAKVVQVTRDHSFLAEAAEDGAMSAEEAARSPWRNAVTRNLGADGSLEVDLFPDRSAAERHRIILCTDGVHNVLDDAEIGRISNETTDIRDLARALAEAALVNGGEDNVAVAAIAFTASGAEKPSPRDRPKREASATPGE